MKLREHINYRGKTPNKINTEISLVTAANIKKGFTDYSERYFVSIQEYDTHKSRGIAKLGDILFTNEAPLGYEKRFGMTATGVKAALVKAGKLKKEKPLPLISEDEIPYDLPDGWVCVGWAAYVIMARQARSAQLHLCS